MYSDYAINNIRLFKEKSDAKIYAGILPPVSYRNALFLNNEVPGIRLAQKLLDDIKQAGFADEQAVAYVIPWRLQKKALKYADGIYLMLPFGKINVAAQFFDEFN